MLWQQVGHCPAHIGWGWERGEGAIVTLSYEATAARVGIYKGRNNKRWAGGRNWQKLVSTSKNVQKWKTLNGLVGFSHLKLANFHQPVLTNPAEIKQPWLTKAGSSRNVFNNVFTELSVTEEEVYCSYQLLIKMNDIHVSHNSDDHDDKW